MVSDATRLQPLVTAIYDAALDPSLWKDTLQVISAALDFDSGFVSWAYRNDSEYSAWRVNSGEWGNWLAAYDRYYHRVFPFTPALQRLAPRALYTNEQLVPRNDLVLTEYYNDYLRPLRKELMAGVLVGATRKHTANFELQRSSIENPITNADLRRLRLLSGHICRAMELNRRIASLQHRAISLLNAMDRLAVGIALLDREARLLYANAAAERLFQTRAIAVTVQNGHMTVSGPKLQQRFRALVESAAATAEGLGFGGGGTLRIGSGTLQTFLTLEVTPLNAQSPVSPVGTPQARTVVLMQACGEASKSTDLFRLAFGLTAAEAQVAVGLAAGESLHELAARRKVSKVTMRNQIRSVMDKTGTRRQSELVRLFASHPATMVKPAD